MKKHLLAVAVCLCVIMSMACIPAVAATLGGGISPMWENTKTVTVNISRSGSTVSWTSNVSALVGTTKTEATYTLYRQGANGTYSYVDSWSNSGTSTILTSSGSATGAAGTYKLVYSISVTTNGKVEKISDEFVKSV